MARIEEYEAKDVKLTPSDKGYAAVEMAARRIGPLYQQMAAGQRELGNMQKAIGDQARQAGEVIDRGDVAIGRATEAFLRFQGLSQQASGTGVKVGKGGAVERTLLGTGAGGDTSWNARANASNDVTEKPSKSAATGTGQTAQQKADAAAGITDPLTPAQKKAVATATATLQREQAADKLKADRNLEDKNIASKRMQEDLDTKIYWDKLGPISSLTGTIQGNETPDQADARAQTEMQIAKDTQASALKTSRLQENSDLQQQRDAQDAAVKEGRAQLTLNDKQDIAHGAKPLLNAGISTVQGLNQTAHNQVVSTTADVLAGATQQRVSDNRNISLPDVNVTGQSLTRAPGSQTVNGIQGDWDVHKPGVPVFGTMDPGGNSPNYQQSQEPPIPTHGAGHTKPDPNNPDGMPIWVPDTEWTSNRNRNLGGAINPADPNDLSAEAQGQPTFLGNSPAIALDNPTQSLDSQDTGGPTPAYSQTIQSPIDQPGDVPGLYSDLRGGM